MPAPTKLLAVVSAVDATNDSEDVLHGSIIWFRDAAAKSEVITAFAEAMGYNQSGNNTVSQAEFFNACVADYITTIIKNNFINKAVTLAAESAQAQFADNV